jgi:hypothetical protein
MSELYNLLKLNCRGKIYLFAFVSFYESYLLLQCKEDDIKINAIFNNISAI